MALAVPAENKCDEGPDGSCRDQTGWPTQAPWVQTPKIALVHVPTIRVELTIMGLVDTAELP